VRVIIAGGAGTIGRRLAAILGADGYDVVILSRTPEVKCSQLPSGVRAFKWDGKTPEGWSHLLDHPDTAIVNLAGESIANWRWTHEHKQRVLASRVDSTRALVQAIDEAEHKPNVLVQASATGYYGDRGDEVIREGTPPNDEWRADVCRQWEEVASQASVRTVVLRIGIVLSQTGGALPAFVKAADMMGSRLGSGKQWIPWIHNDDVCYAIRYLMNHDEASGPFNIVAPEPLRNADFMEAVAHVRGRPAWIPVPAFALFLALGEQALFVLDSQRVLPDKLQGTDFKFHYPKAEDAVRDLMRHGHHWRELA
jgi:uncharacterized protein (TIGR01777 family)